MYYYTSKTEIITLEGKLPTEGYEVVKSFEELTGKNWLLYSKKQATFYEANPTATPEEVYKMELNIHVPTLDELKAAKIAEITAYDSSGAVNSFLFDDMPLWLNKDTRVGLMNSINIEKGSGREITTLWLNGMKIVVPCDLALGMLYAIELYALDCYNVTAEHKFNVSMLETAEEIAGYDFTTGYPEKLNFNN